MYNEKRLFSKYQPLLLQFANSLVGRKFLELTQVEFNLPLIELTPNTAIFFTGKYLTINGKKEPLLIGKFHCGSNYFEKKLASALTDIELITSTYKKKGYLASVESLFHFTGLHTNILKYPLILHMNFSSGAGDGDVFNSNATFLTGRNAGTGTGAEPTATSGSFYDCEFFGGNYNFNRGFFPTDTSAIGASSTITAASLNLFVLTKDSTYDQTIDFIKTSQASTSTLAASDFSAVTFTNGGTGPLCSALTTSAYNVINVNATGLTYISKTGVSKIGTLGDADLTATTPSGRSHAECNYSENGSNTPFLSVTFTSSSGRKAGSLTMMGIGN